MESVGTECNIWMHPSNGVGNNLFDLVSWVEDQLNPSKVSYSMLDEIISTTYPALPLFLMLYLIGLPNYLLPMKLLLIILSNSVFSIPIVDSFSKFIDISKDK